MNFDYCNCDYDSLDVDELVSFTGKPRFKAVYTITLAELIDVGIFDWSKDYLNWSAFAYDSAQYERVCQYFIDRFYYREISMEPFKIWANFLTRKIKYELMPKYKILYAEAAKNVSLQFDGSETRTLNWNESGSSTSTDTSNQTETTNRNENSDDYYKKRDIHSDYPETLLSSNSDYVTSGNDLEEERVREVAETEATTANGTGSEQSESEREHTQDANLTKQASASEWLNNIPLALELFGQIDKQLCDELEVMFVSLYTANYNGF